MTVKKSKSLYRYSRYFKLIFLCWDILLLNITFVISYLLRFGTLERLSKPESQVVFIFSNIIWLLLSSYLGAYKFIRIEHVEKIISKTAKLISLHLIIMFSIVLLLKYEDISRSRLLIFYIILFN